ncbi:MAG: hypothetical protein DIZ80_04640 [endosymbiont of Galathealinum brachiosum]|uniref:Uncharacterized protein n=1 Tax=endosymbiont of Galathealinum brachiosum TaxID=2200906 RepID=A0A370DIK5_9GAMM|nr:MAG: hypothetical protein DIZ80_04640 [endosymbiont of Galathealinum brachiosum]
MLGILNGSFLSLKKAGSGNPNRISVSTNISKYCDLTPCLLRINHYQLMFINTGVHVLIIIKITDRVITWLTIKPAG